MSSTTTLDRLTLLELANRTNNNDLIEIAEVLTVQNEVLKDAVFIEANQLTGHVHTRRLTLPSGTWRLVNKGVDVEASRTKQITEDIGICESRSEIDKILVDLAVDKVKFRTSEDKAFLEGLSQTFVTALIYGNRATNPEQINGWATRYNTLGNMVLSNEGDGADLETSIWIVQWGDNKCHFVYPRGHKSVGVDKEDLGLIDALDENNKKYRAYGSLFQFRIGFCVHDDRCIARICNIEQDDVADPKTFDPKLLNKIFNRMPDRGKGAVIYCNESIKTQIDNHAMDKTNVNYTVKDVYGEPVTHFQVYPIRLMNSILNTEAIVT